MEKTVVKVGGSAITYKDVESFPLTIDKIKENAHNYINNSSLKRLVTEIYSANPFPLIFVHGVGPFGHYLVEKQHMLSRKEIIHESVAYLNEIVTSYFKGLGKKVSSCAPFDYCKYVGNGKFDMIDLFRESELALALNGMLITYGDIVPTTLNVKGNCGSYQVISGDDLVIHLAELWGAKRIIVVTDVDGFFNKDPKVYKDGALIKEIKSREKLMISETRKRIDVTGVMPEKIRKLQIAASKGIKSQIINGLKKDNLKKALLRDESIGTLILP